MLNSLVWAASAQQQLAILRDGGAVLNALVDVSLRKPESRLRFADIEQELYVWQKTFCSGAV
jgi:hypothetical protein